ncbi:hypothetical protein H9Q69_005826 [Fusarium xylarioides]|nr:hypothetical protein H9Q69_005826 [Fusarium xylarioides]
MLLFQLLLLPLFLLGPHVFATKHEKVFDLTLTWEAHAPDGFKRDMILVNGQFPGPLIELTEGDDIQVNVHNEMPFNTTIHFHGIEMLHTPWSDGVPGLTQVPIPPGTSFTYRWTATQHGSHWYHSHVGAQLGDGLYGPIIIHPHQNREKPFSLISQHPASIQAMENAERRTKPIMLSDLRHVTSFEAWDIATKANMELTCSDSILVNGKGSSRCRSLQEIDELVTPEQRALLRASNMSMTDKGCLPAEFMARGVGDPTAIPNGIYRGCKSSDGGRAIIAFEKSPCQAETWIGLDLVGAFGIITSMVSIDGLAMWVYAVDGDYVVPQKVEAIPISNGDRYSVLIKPDRVGNYTLRVASVAATQIVSGSAIIAIRQGQGDSGTSNDTSVPTQYIRDNGIPTSPEVAIFNESLAKPFPPSPIPRKADAFYKLEMQSYGSSPYWAIDETPLHPAQYEHLESPILFDKHTANSLKNHSISTKTGQWVDLVFTSKVFPMPPHPLHKHGNKLRLLGQGTGKWIRDSIAEAAAAMPEAFNLVDPPRRDAFSSPNAGDEPVWLAVRYHVVNPGPWLMHCHILTHSEGGMSFIIEDGIDDWPKTPDYYLQISRKDDECSGRN